MIVDELGSFGDVMAGCLALGARFVVVLTDDSATDSRDDGFVTEVFAGSFLVDFPVDFLDDLI